jgi:hypothetical protein
VRTRGALPAQGRQRRDGAGRRWPGGREFAAFLLIALVIAARTGLPPVLLALVVLLWPVSWAMRFARHGRRIGVPGGRPLTRRLERR